MEFWAVEWSWQQSQAGETFEVEQIRNPAKQVWTSGLSLYPQCVSLSLFFLEFSATKPDSYMELVSVM